MALTLYSTNIMMYLPVCRGLHALNMQTYGEAVCPVLTLHKIYEGALIFTEHTIKVFCLHLVSRLETQPKKVKCICMTCIEHT